MALSYINENDELVFELALFIELMDWSQGATDFIRYGQIRPLNHLAKQKSSHLPKKTRQNLRTVVDSFLNLQNEHIIFIAKTRCPTAYFSQGLSEHVKLGMPSRIT